MTFLEFLALVGVTPEPGQRVFWAVAADGVQPGDLQGDDREIARELLGPIDAIHGDARRQIAVIKGADVGFSFLGGLRLLHRALTATELGAPGEIRPALCAAPDLRLGRIAVRNALGAAESVPAIKRLIDSRGADGFTIRREGGRFTSVECLPATVGGRALRGRRYVEALFDECAFFRDSDYAINDAECIRAVAPRCVGQLWLGSTPWLESAAIWQMYERNYGHPLDALAARVPTLLVRTDPQTRARVHAAREIDPEGAAREFDCAPLESGSDAFFSSGALAMAATDGPARIEPVRGAWVAAGADFAFVSDSSALVIVQALEGVFHVSDVIELRPKRGKPLVPSEVCEQFAGAVLKYGGNQVVADGHAREALREHLDSHGLFLKPLPEGQRGKFDQYTKTRALLHEGRIRIPSSQVKLLGQLREVTATPQPGGGVSIRSPRKRGGHGDLASAFVAAIWDLSADTQAQLYAEQLSKAVFRANRETRLRRMA